MIKVILNSLPLDGNLASQITNTKFNQSIESYAKAVELLLKGKVCSQHPKLNQEVVVSFDQMKKFAVAKNDFCCDRFFNSVDLTLVQVQ